MREDSFDPRSLDLAVGGQAVIEGVMMRCPTAIATAVRTPAGEIVIERKPYKGFAARFYRALCVFLANRLSRSDVMIGSGARSASEILDSDEDEITPEALDNMALAGARFDWFLQRVRSE